MKLKVLKIKENTISKSNGRFNEIEKNNYK